MAKRNEANGVPKKWNTKKKLRPRTIQKASKVKVTKPDGTVEIQNAYDRIALKKILGRDSLSRKLRNEGRI